MRGGGVSVRKVGTLEFSFPYGVRIPHRPRRIKNYFLSVLHIFARGIPPYFFLCASLEPNAAQFSPTRSKYEEAGKHSPSFIYFILR